MFSNYHYSGYSRGSQREESTLYQEASKVIAACENNTSVKNEFDIDFLIDLSGYLIRLRENISSENYSAIRDRIDFINDLVLLIKKAGTNQQTYMLKEEDIKRFNLSTKGDQLYGILVARREEIQGELQILKLSNQIRL
jgi:hypothetical protein